MRLVPALGLREREQDVALLAVAARGELAVDPRFGALVDQIAGPATTVAGGGFGGRAQ